MTADPERQEGRDARPGKYVKVADGVAQDSMCVIWSAEHGAYWRPGGAGYTTALLGAGAYSFAEACEWTHGCGPEKMIEIRRLEAVVPEPGTVHEWAFRASPAGGEEALRLLEPNGEAGSVEFDHGEPICQYFAAQAGPLPEGAPVVVLGPDQIETLRAAITRGET